MEHVGERECQVGEAESFFEGASSDDVDELPPCETGERRAHMAMPI